MNTDAFAASPYNTEQSSDNALFRAQIPISRGRKKLQRLEEGYTLPSLS
jgi:hypothetical protein